MEYFLSISEEEWRNIEADPPEDLMRLLETDN